MKTSFTFSVLGLNEKVYFVTFFYRFIYFVPKRPMTCIPKLCVTKNSSFLVSFTRDTTWFGV